MEFRDKLLSSEIRHVTEMVNMISYELVILQDFLKNEFGIRYTKFRNRHVLAFEGAAQNKSLAADIGGEGAERGGGNSSGSRRFNEGHAHTQTTQATTSSSVESTGIAKTDPLATTTGTTTMRTRSAGATSQTGNTNAQYSVASQGTTFESEGEEAMATYESRNEEVEDYGSDGDSNTSGNDVKSGGFNDPDYKYRAERGRTRGGIWKHFDWRKLPNGRTLVRCRTCFASVSAVPKRMERHYMKCTLKKPEDEFRTVLSSPIAKRPPTRTKGSVWSHFDIKTGPEGKTLVICKYCQTKVSNHSTRMSRHLQSCHESPVYLESQSQTQRDAPSDDESAMPAVPNVVGSTVGSTLTTSEQLGTLGNEFSGFGT